jgi:hypothetical protein
MMKKHNIILMPTNQNTMEIQIPKIELPDEFVKIIQQLYKDLTEYIVPEDISSNPFKDMLYKNNTISELRKMENSKDYLGIKDIIDEVIEQKIQENQGSKLEEKVLCYIANKIETINRCIIQNVNPRDEIEFLAHGLKHSNYNESDRSCLDVIQKTNLLNSEVKGRITKALSIAEEIALPARSGYKKIIPTCLRFLGF